ncbi:MAG: hypothetical protein OXH76_16425 [Boseongicola sp.]|nr:hypothetical protein [Boseongicola sp.]
MKLCIACLNTNHETDLLLSVENAEFLKNAVAEVSREEGTGINQFVIVAIAERLAALRTERFFAERRALADADAVQRILFRDGGQPPDPEDRLPQVGECERVSSDRQEGRRLAAWRDEHRVLSRMLDRPHRKRPAERRAWRGDQARHQGMSEVPDNHGIARRLTVPGERMNTMNEHRPFAKRSCVLAGCLT